MRQSASAYLTSHFGPDVGEGCAGLGLATVGCSRRIIQFLMALARLPLGAVDSSKPDDAAELVGSKNVMCAAEFDSCIVVPPSLERSVVFDGALHYAGRGLDLSPQQPALTDEYVGSTGYALDECSLKLIIYL